MPARLSSLAIDWVTFLFLSSNEPAQPTQYRYSVVSGSPGSTIVHVEVLGPVGALALVHAPRVALVLHARKAPPSSGGKLLSISVR